MESLSPKGRLYIFLDEIQEVAEWEKWVLTMQELKKAQIILFGSNAKLLSQEFSSLLSGRHLDLIVPPPFFQRVLGIQKS